MSQRFTFIWLVEEITSYDLRSKLLEALWFCDAWLNDNIYWLTKSNLCASETTFIQQKKELWRKAVAKKGFLLSLQALSTIMYYQLNDSLEVLKTVLSTQTVKFNVRMIREGGFEWSTCLILQGIITNRNYGSLDFRSANHKGKLFCLNVLGVIQSYWTFSCSEEWREQLN